MDESPTPEEPSAADLQPLRSQVDELKAQIKALEERRMHCFYEMLPQPKKFKGTTADRKNRVVHDFLANFENYVKPAKLDDDHKIAILRTYLDGPAANLFNEAGEFETYEAAKRWLIENFIPERSMFERWCAFAYELRQQPGESFHDFQHRYNIAYTELPEPLPEFWILWFFKEFLLPQHKEQVDSSSEFNRYKGYTISDVVDYLARINPGGVERYTPLQTPPFQSRKRRRQGSLQRC
jgi:hypothetical protein